MVLVSRCHQQFFTTPSVSGDHRQVIRNNFHDGVGTIIAKGRENNHCVLALDEAESPSGIELVLQQNLSTLH